MQITAQLGTTILADLRKKFPEIPKSGILAGGAVADWFFGLEPNDLDVFVKAEKNHFKQQLFGTKTADFGIPESTVDNYERTLCIAWKHLYKVISSKRDGMLNIIACQCEYLTAAKVISGFDLNATRVAIDLETERLVWDESFSLFLKNRQLKITALFTPAHTAIRYFLKKERLQCEGYDDDEMAIAISAWSSQRVGNTPYMLPVNFGEMYLEKAEKAMEFGLSDYFSIEPDSTEKFWTLKPEAYTNLDTSELSHIMFPVHAPQALRSQLIEISPAYKTKMKFVEDNCTNSNVFTMLRLFRGSYVRGQLSERILKTVSSFLNYRPGLYPLILGMPLERQCQVIRRLFRFSKRNGIWIYQMIQAEGTQNDLVSDEALSAFVLKFEPIFGKNFKTVDASFSRKFLWYEITQLVSLKAISTAHEELKIPLLSYYELTKKGIYVISIKSKLSKKDYSVSVIGAVYDLPFSVFKNQSRRNSETTLGCSLAAFWFCSNLNGNNIFSKAKNFAKFVANKINNARFNKIEFDAR
jgi:hypothetical protein